MNKIFKRVVATLLTVAAFATIEPAKYINLMSTEAHAADTESKMITDIEVKKSSSSSSMQFYDDKKCKSHDKVDFEEKDTIYYVDAGSRNRVYISANVKAGYSYEISKGSKEYDEDDKISLSSSSTRIYVKVYEDANSTNGNKKTLKETYKIYVQRDKDDDDDDDDEDEDDYDDIYLDRLKVGSETINLKESKTTYTVDVDKSTTSVKITAEPDDDDYEVKIDGKEVDDDDDYKRNVSLKEGKNEFEIKLKDDEDRRKYTVIINRGTSTSKDEDKTNNNNTNVNIKPDQWVIVNGNLVYNDSAGNPIKNSWFLDRNVGKWYYLQSNGTMKKGWLATNTGWYYLNQYSGQMQTGWSYINNKWYYLNQYNGQMRTGWINDNGTWYYCNYSGEMLKNTTVNGCRLGSNGAWIR